MDRKSYRLFKSVWHRASQDTEAFRSKKLWFWGVEVIGGGAVAALPTVFLWHSDKLNAFQAGLITFAAFVVGFLLIYCLIFLCHLIYELSPKAKAIEAQRANPSKFISIEPFTKLKPLEVFYKVEGEKLTAVFCFVDITSRILKPVEIEMVLLEFVFPYTYISAYSTKTIKFHYNDKKISLSYQEKLSVK